MLTSIIAAAVLSQSPAVPTPRTPKLEFASGVFVITDSTGVTRVNPKPTPTIAARAFQIKSGNKSIAWSEKGLTVTVGQRTRSTRFSDLPVSPRFFSSEALAEVNALLAKKEIAKEASGLSGWEQVGDIVYLLPRWNNPRKAAWLEMLVKVDMAQPVPWFETLAVWKGLTTSSLTVEDLLAPAPGGLRSVSDLEGGWGVTTWIEAEPGETTYQEFGRYPRSFAWNSDFTELRFVERTSYGTQLAGRVDLLTQNRANLSEGRDPILFPGETSDILQTNTTRQVVLRNADSGLELRLPLNVGTRNVAPGVLVWTPRDKPTQAVLYSKVGLRAIARWPAPAPTKPPPARATRPKP